MPRAADLRDRIGGEIDRTGFVARGIHVRVGDETAEQRWAADVRAEIHSVAKAFSVLAAAIAVDEGAVSFDEPVGDILRDADLGPGVDHVTMRHLLSMNSGIDLPWSATMMTDWPDLAAEFLSRPTYGRRFQYSNASTYTAMHVLAQRVGDIEQYLRPRLLEPLGIGDASWTRCPLGRVLAGEGLSLRTEEMARLGHLIRDGGVYDGRRLVSAAGVAVLHSAWVDTGSIGEGYRRYAMAGWEGPGPAWRLHGAYGQLIVFAADAVVTVTADDHAGADDVAAFVAAVAHD